jgi:ATP-binding cassette subfamily B multidrug efflux pump
MSRERLGRVRKWFWLTWEGSLGVLSAIVVLSFLVAGTQVIFPYLWQFLVDEMHPDADPERIEILALWMLGIGCIHSILYALLQALRTLMNSKVQWRARRRIYDHLSRLPPQQHSEWRPGDLVTRMTDDSGEKISWFLCSGIFRCLEAGLIVLCCTATMWLIDPVLTLWVVLPLPFLLVAQALGQGALATRYAEVQTSISGINDSLSSTFSGIRIVQACHLQDAHTARFRTHIKEQREAEIRTATVQQGIFMLYGYGWQAAIGALLIFGGLHVLDGSLSLGEYVTFEGCVMVLVWPMFDVGMFVSRYQQAVVALERIDELMDQTVQPHCSKPPIATLPSRVELDGVDVTTPGGTRLLERICLKIESGQKVAIVGRVGSGKSTLLSLVAGLHPLSAGSYRLGEMPAVDHHPATRQATIALVPQDPILLSTTLRENISLGREVDPAQLSEALRISRLQPDLAELPDGLDTVVGERGLTLSGGQQQRVALARALVGRPKVLLLDDATAALDAATESAFWDEMARSHPETTILLVTHRVSTLQMVDQIVVLESGREIERGTHSSLMNEAGLYTRLYGELTAHSAQV